CRDLSISADVRLLLAGARDALRSASSDAETARLRYHALFDAVPDPGSILDENGIVLDLNRAGIAAYRRPREEIVGQPIEVLNPDLPKGHLGPVWDTINRGRTYVVEVTNMRADGTRFPVEVHTAGFEHDGRKCLVAVARDLSSRHEAELRYRELMEVIDKGIVVQDDQLRFIYGNSAALRLLGVASGDSLDEAMQLDRWMIVREDGTVMPEADYPAVRAMRGGRIIESTLLGLYHRERRQLSWLSITVVPQFAADADTPHQVLSMFSDVTALKRDSALFDRVQSLAHIGGWEWDCTTDRLYLTDESARILAQAQPPGTMPRMIDCLAPACRLRLPAALWRAIDQGRGFDLQLQGARADGHAFWVRAIGGLVPDDPATSRLTGTLQDITEIKHGEETLRVQARSDPLTGLLNRVAILGEISARLDDPAQARLAEIGRAHV